MKDEVLKNLTDALDASKYVKEFTRDITFEDYQNDELLKSAVERKFEIVGEALNRIKKIDASILERISEWRDIIGFRNNLAHCYESIDHTLVWSIVEEDLDALLTDISSVIKASEGRSQKI